MSKHIMDSNRIFVNTVQNATITSEMIIKAYDDMCEVVSAMHDNVCDYIDFHLDKSGPFITFSDEGGSERFGLVPPDIWETLNEEAMRVILKNHMAHDSWLNIDGEGKLVYLVNEWLDFMIRLYLTCLRKYVTFNFHDKDDCFFDHGFELSKTNYDFKWLDCFVHEIEPVLRDFGLMKGQSRLEAKLNRAINSGKLKRPVMSWS